MLMPDPADRPRLVEIAENLEARVAEAEREGWLGEVEDLAVSLQGARDKVAQIDASIARKNQAVHLGMPTFSQIAGRVSA